MILSNHPIGIFDSGIGGLTVARAVTQLLPHEDIVYFGDTAHLPYGDKSTATIQAYSVKICDFLLKQKCKVILIACNSASAAAYDLIKEYVGNKASVLNVIDPVISHVREYFSNQRLGLIGTKQTVNSDVHRKKIADLNLGIQLNTLATPLLVPIIEEGFSENTITEQVLHQYLSHPNLANIDALILACTHYPLIKEQIDRYYQQKVAIIDSSDVTAHALKAWLAFHDLQNKQPTGTKRFYISDYTPSFAASTQLFFGESAHLEHCPLWE